MASTHTHTHACTGIEPIFSNRCRAYPNMLRTLYLADVMINGISTTRRQQQQQQQQVLHNNIFAADYNTDAIVSHHLGIYHPRFR